MLNIKEFYLQTSIFTDAGPYVDYYRSLPDNLEELTRLVLDQTIHRKELIRSCIKQKETGISDDKIAEEYPWWKYRSHDDILLTASAITSELFRLDYRGFVHEREIRKKVVITCRYVAVLMASILKAKGIPARVRSGFADYFSDKGIFYDHWIVQYYDEIEDRWVNVDPDPDSGSTHTDLEHEKFGWIAEIWLDVRSGKKDISKYVHGTRFKGLNMLAYTLFFDFHALMGDEISYLFFPTYIDSDEFFSLSPDDLKELDDIALLMLDPQANFEELRYIFYNDKKLRVLNSPLLGKGDHQEL